MPMPIQLRRPEVPDAMATALDRMLAKDPSKRFATPAEVVEAWLPFCSPPPPPPMGIVLPAWDPAVVERIGATISEPATQRLEETPRPAPETNRIQAHQVPASSPITQSYLRSNRVSVPRWLAVSTLLLLAACVGWIIYREASLANDRPAEQGRPEAKNGAGQLLVP